ncbi:MAG: glycogen debranching protein [Paenibacillus macerans]|uniref:alpha-L-rhamnosidase-related protein n=1 Tax=Paenibacillus macerans TaxID=44252 RepID=UPI00242BE203|nr:glycogen debranching protein [Paenibacillus macerans]MBS5912902.1 glycogen debranching protein [Paenibacillus macerans]
MSRLTSRHPLNLYYHGGEYVKICGSQDGYFPDFGHHLAGEMGGVWLHPIKLLDGFWLKVTDLERGISVWARADAFVSEPWGGRFEYDHWLGHIPVSIERSQFAPEREKGFVADYRVFANAGLPVRLRLELLVRTDLRPVWFSEQAGVVDGDRDVPVEIADRQVLVKDQDNSWFVRVGTDLPGTAVEADPELYGPEFTAGAGCGISFAAEVELQAGETFDFRLFAAGSYTSQEECDRSYELISQRHEALLAEKQALYREIAERASLEIEGEPGLNEAFAWAKWNNQWLVQTVDGLGRGLTAGGPTYPWWFGCDSTYALQGVLAIGDPGLARDTLDLLLKKSEETNGNGRVVHEITTLGAVANPGNTQETAHYIAFVWEMFQWTGDEALLRRHYDYCVKGIEWLLGEMDPDGDLFPSGYGIIEIAGLNMELIDSAVYTAQALRAMAAMSGFFGEHERSAKYGELAERAAEAVNRVFWREADGLYADAVAPREMVAAKREAMVSLAEKHGVAGYGEYMERILQDTAGQEGDIPWLLNKNWVIVTPMEAGIADPDKAARALETMRSDVFVGEYGTYLSGILQQGTMTISTGVHAVAEAENGHPDEALELLRRMLRTFSSALPGSFSEMSPDYGCVVQAWTLYALAVPVIRGFFGVRPQAHRRVLRLNPQLPAVWHDRECKLSGLNIAGVRFDIVIRPGTDGQGRVVTVRNDERWRVVLELNGERLESDEPWIEWEVGGK